MAATGSIARTRQRSRFVSFVAGSAPRLTLANGRLLGSSKAHYELVDRPELADLGRSSSENAGFEPGGRGFEPLRARQESRPYGSPGICPASL